MHSINSKLVCAKALELFVFGAIDAFYKKMASIAANISCICTSKCPGSKYKLQSGNFPGLKNRKIETELYTI